MFFLMSITSSLHLCIIKTEKNQLGSKYDNLAMLTSITFKTAVNIE